MAATDSFQRGFGFGLDIIDRRDAKKRQERQDERQAVMDERRQVQWERQDQQAEQQQFRQARQMAMQDLELALKSGDPDLYEQSATALGLSPPAFNSERWSAHQNTLSEYRAGNIRQNDPRMIELYNDVLATDLKNRPNANPNWDYRIKTSTPSPDGEGVQFLLEVTDEDGKTWEAPMTEGASVGQGKVQTVVPQKLLGRVKSYMDIGQALHDDPESSRAIDEMIGAARERDEQQQWESHRREQMVGFGMAEPPSPSEREQWVAEFQQFYGRNPTQDEMDQQFGIERDQGLDPMVRTVDGNLVERDPETGSWGLAYQGESSPSERPTDRAADGYLYYRDTGERVYPDVADPDAGGGGDGAGGMKLSYQNDLDERIFQLQGLQPDEFGILNTDYPAQNRQIQNRLSSLAIEYGGGQNYAADADAISQVARDMPLTLEDAMNSVVQEQGIDLERNPEREEEVLRLAQQLIDRNLKVIEARLAAKADPEAGNAAGQPRRNNTPQDTTSLFY